MDPSRSHTGIAIIGMACRVSGANNPSELWDVLASSADTRQEITRFNSAGFYSSGDGSQTGTTNVKHAYFIKDDVDKFDHVFFDLSPPEAAAMDPQHRILLEVGYEAFENAGIPMKMLAGSSTGVFSGVSGSDYTSSLLRDIDVLPRYHSTGSSIAMAANRISYHLDLRGPSIVTDTACSSSASALHQAILSLRAGDCSMALVTGSNLILSPDSFLHMSNLGFLSPDGISHSFDASGNGYGRGEGVLAIVLKPLAQALEDGDCIQSIICGSSINQDGHTNGITLPSSTAQELNMTNLYSSSNMHPSQIQYVEAHGTGTAIGDPIEISAINNVFNETSSDRKLIVGSIKSSVGHLEAGAALAGIIKTVKCLQEGKIPPQNHFHQPNPNMDLSKIIIPTSLMPWPETHGLPRRAAVNSFGFGGTNGHIILEHSSEPSISMSTDAVERPYIFKVSAASENSLRALSQSYTNYISSAKPSLPELAHTTLNRRSTLAKSRYIVASTHHELAFKLQNSKSSPVGKRDSSTSDALGFIFTGQGAHWPTMGKHLIMHSYVFRSIIEKCDEVLASLPDRPSWTLRRELIIAAEASSIHKPIISQTACTALQIGLVELWKSWGIEPRFVLGHSSGEIAACYAAGAYSLEETILIAYYRGKFIQEYQESSTIKGSMCAVGLGHDDCTAFLREANIRASIAAINSPRNCTVSGDLEAIDYLVLVCQERQIFHRRLQVDIAYHSTHMDPVAKVYQATLDGLLQKSSGLLAGIPSFKCDIFSTLTGRRLLPSDLSSGYWARNLCAKVQFSRALEAAAGSYDSISLIEIGPHPAMKSASNDIFSRQDGFKVLYFASCRRDISSFESMLEAAAKMMACGIDLNGHEINGIVVENDDCLEMAQRSPRILSDIPSYAWDHSQSHWIESRASQQLRFRNFPRHSILGSRAFGDNPTQLLWRNHLTAADLPGIEDTIIDSDVLSVAYGIHMALEAITQVSQTFNLQSCFTHMKDLQFHRTLCLLDLRKSTMETCLSLLRNSDADSYSLVISALTGESEASWTVYCTGTVQLVPIGFLRAPLEKISARHNPQMLRYVRDLGIFEMSAFHNVCVDGSQMAGQIFDDDIESSCSVQLFALAAVLQIPEMLMVSSNALARHRISRVSSLQVHKADDSRIIGSFQCKQSRLSAARSSSQLIFETASSGFMDLGGVETRAHVELGFKAPLQSNFFEAQILPDISLLKQSNSMHIATLFQLISHKWPMGDVGLGDISQDEFIRLHDSIAHPKVPDRTVCRLLGATDSDFFEKAGLQKIKNLQKAQLYLTIGTASWVTSKMGLLHPPHLVCMRLDSESDGFATPDSWEPVCSILGISDDRWVLGRHKIPIQCKEEPTLKIHVFTTKDPTELQCHKLGMKSLFVSKVGGEATPNFSQSQMREFDSHVIVMDCAEKSLLVDTSGQSPTLWLQSIFPRIKSLVWVSKREALNPFCDVASSFIKTLLSESALLAATNLIVEDSVGSAELLSLALDANDRVLAGYNEIEVTIRKSRVFISRYRPDEVLSASAGAIPPLRTIGHPATQPWGVVQSHSQKVILCAARQLEIPTVPKSCLAHVRIDASVIDHIDMLVIQGEAIQPTNHRGLCRFFAGSINFDHAPNKAAMTRVVGWHNGPHCSDIHVEVSELHTVPIGMPQNHAVVHFAAYSLALALIDGLIRPLRGEKVRSKIGGAVGEALQKVCQTMDVATVNDCSTDYDFTIEFDIKVGFIINSRPVDVDKYLEASCRHRAKDFMNNDFLLKSSLQIFNLAEVNLAFATAKQSPGSTVLSSSVPCPPTEMWVTEAPKTTSFREDACYVIIGGLSGLGKQLVFWMLARGAKHIVSMSRRGLASTGAFDMVQDVEKLGGTLLVLTVDACNEQDLSDAVSHTRSFRPIRGYINMAMELANSPFSTMSPDQWTRPIRTKVQSSWNLHQLSLADELDFFIMFSSVSSLSGNRAQANYAVGNSFQNSLARYRKASLGLPGMSIALGAIKGIGVLAEDESLLNTLSRNGLRCFDRENFETIVEAAFVNILTSNSVIYTGLQRFVKANGCIQCDSDASQIFWSEWPEFGFMFDYQHTDEIESRPRTFLDQLRDLGGIERQQVLFAAFSRCLADILGRNLDDFDPEMSIASYGLDSLNTVSCRHWLFKNLRLDVSVFDILACKSIEELLKRLLDQLDTETLFGIEPLSHSRMDLKHRPLSHSQQRIWFMQQYLQDKTLNNLVLECEVVGQVDIEVFSQTWSYFVKRHESLHSRYVSTAHGLQQLPVEDPCFPISVVTTCPEEFEQVCSLASVNSRSHEFDLESGDLVRGWLVLSQAGQARFFLASHHMAWDRSSVDTIFTETSLIYASIKNHEDPGTKLGTHTYQIVDFALWQDKWLKSGRVFEKHARYWSDQLAALPSPVSLFPVARVQTRPEVKTYSFNTLDSEIGRETVDEIHGFCRTHAVTPFMLITSTLSLLVTQLTGDLDVVIGIADGDRGHSAFDKLVGFTVNMLAIRTKLNSVRTRYFDFLQRYRETCLDAYRYRALPFDVLVQQLQVPRSTSHSQIFQIVVNYQTAGEFKDCDYGDFKLTNYLHHNAKPQCDFRLDVEETKTGKLRCVWTYDSSLYHSEGFSEITTMFGLLLTKVLRCCSERYISDLNLSLPSKSSPDDYCDILAEKTEEMVGTTFADIFTQAAYKQPEKTAVIAKTGSITYRELSTYTVRIATFLENEASIVPGANVGIYCPESIEMIIGIYGVLRAGLTYIPLDTESTEERLDKMIQEANVSFILTGAGDCYKLRRIIGRGNRKLSMERIEPLASEERETDCSVSISREERSNGFCCIFTSGTTGSPKGIVVGRRQLRCQMQSYHDFLGTDSSDRMLLASSICFDMSLTSIYGTILRGATLVIADREMRLSPSRMVAFAMENRVTNCTLTTTQLNLLLGQDKAQLSRWTSLRTLVVGGEDVPALIVSDFYALGLLGAILFNGYGPTETTVCNALGQLSPQTQSDTVITVGKPLPSAQFYLLDADLNIVPRNVAGELYIGGPVLNERYLKRGDLTAASFVDYHISGDSAMRVKLYKTGDLARMTNTGEYIILGRIDGDRQAKIRGIRTELGEIEDSIKQSLDALGPYSGAISMVSVVYIKPKSVLAAFMVGRVNSEFEERQLLKKLQFELKSKLPLHMIPNQLIILDDLPQTVSGKLDYTAIKALPLVKPTPLLKTSSAISETAPLFASEVASIWREAIGVGTEVSLDDDFFSLGGHSLLLLQVQKKISESLGITISLMDMFTNSSLRALCNLLSEEKIRMASASEATDSSGNDTSESESFQCPYKNTTEDLIDWKHELRLPQEFNTAFGQEIGNLPTATSPTAIAIVGACTMAGAQLLCHVLQKTNVRVYCIAVEKKDPAFGNSRMRVENALRHWGLLDQIDLERRRDFSAHSGSLSQENLGLTQEEIALLKMEIKTLYIMDSEVSLLKSYNDLSTSNVGSLKFLISLACSDSKAPMAIHYLSTWGVPHLQTWKGTKRPSQFVHRDEVEMSDMEPSGDSALGYLKARWVCEGLLCKVAALGYPVSIYRSCMCSSSRESQTPLDREDINRRILEGILQTGLVPDFRSDEGGGMSWISADYLIDSIFYLSQRCLEPTKGVQIHHIVSDTHILYSELPEILHESYDGRPLEVVNPRIWFKALRSRHDPDMTMHAEVLDTWYQAGWLPFQLEVNKILADLKEGGFVPPRVDRGFLMAHVVGKNGF